MTENEKIKILVNLLNAQEWAFRVQLSSGRVQQDGADFCSSATDLQSSTGDTLDVEKRHLSHNSKMNADVYYFALSLANYIKAVEMLPEEIQIERFAALKTEIISIRNIKEHWEDNSLEKLMSGGLEKRSIANFKVFQERAHDFLVLPFSLTISKDGEVTIAGSIEVKWVFEEILKNNKIIEDFDL